MKKIAIIWAGPAWIYTSLLLKNFSWKVFLFEENEEVWKKLKLTWGWKMNVTNSLFSVENFSSNEERILNNFFKNPITKNPEKIFDEIWVEYFWKNNRAILKSENAVLEVKRLNSELQNQNNLKILTWKKVEKIDIFDKKFELFFDWKKDIFDYLIIATGWVFRVWKEYSKDKIYSLIKDLDHKITKTSPSLSPLFIQNTPFKELAWTSFKWILKTWKKEVIDDILFTHKWISGPAVLDFSSFLTWENFEISFISNEKEEIFISKFEKERFWKRKIDDFLKQYFPKKIIYWILNKINLEKNININEISKEKFKLLKENIFNFKVIWAKKMDYKFCWTTKGWVSLKEININNLESKIHKNLFFAWEILDINWLCGGYNISFWAISWKIISDKILK